MQRCDYSEMQLLLHVDGYCELFVFRHFLLTSYVEYLFARGALYPISKKLRLHRDSGYNVCLPRF